MVRDLTITVRLRWWLNPVVRCVCYLAWLLYPVYLLSPAASTRCLDWLSKVVVRAIIRRGVWIDHALSV